MSGIAEQRQIFLPSLLTNLEEMKGNSLRYKYSYIENIISLQKDLALPFSIITLLNDIVSELKQYNKFGSTFTTKITKLIEPIKNKYSTSEINIGGFILPLHKIPDENFDIEKICKKVLNDQSKLSIEYHEQHMSRVLHTINLKDLDSSRRTALCEDLRKLRTKSYQLLSFRKLEDSQEKINSKIQLIEKNLAKFSA